MVGGAGYAIGRGRGAGDLAGTPVARARPVRAGDAGGAASEANRIDALTKLKSLRDDGVLTQEQYDSERARLTAGI